MFGKSKKKPKIPEIKTEVPKLDEKFQLPQFPKPESQPSIDLEPEFPSYSPVLNEKEPKEMIKNPEEIFKPKTLTNMPKIISQPKIKPTFEKEELELDSEPMEEFHEPIAQVSKEDKNLFIKIDKYEHAMKMVDKVRDDIKEAEDIFDKLIELRKEEDKELESWSDDLKRIKGKMMTIDQTFFEE
ncbi:hypothetical protein K8R47_03540 [archaeon]|nr:hypothetical protein [archaeon]